MMSTPTFFFTSAYTGEFACRAELKDAQSFLNAVMLLTSSGFSFSSNPPLLPQAATGKLKHKPKSTAAVLVNLFIVTSFL